MEVFGEYKKKLLTKLSFSWRFEDIDGAFGLALESSGDLPWKGSPKALLKAGWAGKNFFFHPAYNVSLLFQNYDGSQALKAAAAEGESEAEAEEAKQKEASAASKKWTLKEGRLNSVIYFAPILKFALSDKLDLSPSALAAFDPEQNDMSYELNLKARFFLEESFAVSLAAGALYKDKLDFGLLSKASVSF